MASKSLKDFVTSEKDQLRRISHIPNNDFRMWEEDIVKEQRTSAGGSEMQDDFGKSQNDPLEVEMFDDFVLIERTELKKYNKKKKIEKEEQIKDSGSSTALLIAKPGSNPDT